ncbi:MAG: C13 family peptidase [Pseudomonadota bacterium]
MSAIGILGKNLQSGIRLAMARPVQRTDFAFGSVALFLLYAAFFMAWALFDMIDMWPIAAISPWGITSALSQMLLSIVALYLGITLAGHGHQAGRFQVMAVAGLVPLSLFWGAVSLLVDTNIQSMAFVTALSLAAFLSTAIVLLRATSRLRGARLWQGLVPTALMIVATISPSIFVGNYPMFETYYDEDYAAEDIYKPVDVEGIYYAQPELMSQALEQIRPGVPDQPELFAVLGSYYPHEGVFRREVEAVGNLLEARYAAEGRVVRLVNSEETSGYPLANKPNLRQSLAALGNAMNGREDVLLVFLTSHGTEGLISAGYSELAIPELTATDLATLLDESGIANAIVIVSACYSGSFLPVLRSETRMVITASAADRNSFGCADDREWTYFGEAMFDHALRETYDFGEAFSVARELVGQWETDQGLTPSLPQISTGADIGPALDTLTAHLSR